MINTNDTAPDFESRNQSNQAISLKSYRGQRNVILYFYPKDDTPGCTIEANQFTDLVDDFAALDTVIIGVSKDDCASHKAFVDKFGLRIDLIADTSGEVCDAYGVWQEKERDGKKSMGIVRSTFLIDKDGIVRSAEYGVVADGHAHAMLEQVKTLSH